MFRCAQNMFDKLFTPCFPKLLRCIHFQMSVPLSSFVLQGSVTDAVSLNNRFEHQNTGQRWRLVLHPLHTAECWLFYKLAAVPLAPLQTVC